MPADSFPGAAKAKALQGLDRQRLALHHAADLRHGPLLAHTPGFASVSGNRGGRPPMPKPEPRRPKVNPDAPPFVLPDVPLDSAEHIAQVSAAAIAAVASGAMDPQRGTALSSMLERHRKALETNVLERRLAALEGRETANDAPFPWSKRGQRAHEQGKAADFGCVNRRSRLQPEAAIRRAVRAHLETGGWFVFPIVQSALSYRGIADLCAVRDGRTVWVECKTRAASSPMISAPLRPTRRPWRRVYPCPLRRRRRPPLRRARVRRRATVDGRPPGSPASPRLDVPRADAAATAPAQAKAKTPTPLAFVESLQIADRATGGLIDFRLYPAQHKMLKAMVEADRLVIVKSRQLGAVGSPWPTCSTWPPSRSRSSSSWRGRPSKRPAKASLAWPR